MARLLLVEDDLELARGITGALHADGHEVVHTPTGHEALGLVGTTNPRAVVLDLGLPTSPGWRCWSRFVPSGIRPGS